MNVLRLSESRILKRNDPNCAHNNVGYLHNWLLFKTNWSNAGWICFALRRNNRRACKHFVTISFLKISTKLLENSDCDFGHFDLTVARISNFSKLLINAFDLFLSFEFSTIRICKWSVNRAWMWRVLRKSARAIYVGFKVAIIRKGEGRNTGSSCVRATAGKQAARHAGPKVSPPEGPYYGLTRIPTYIHIGIYIRSSCWTKSEMMPHARPSGKFAHVHVYIGQPTTQYGTLILFPSLNKRAPRCPSHYTFYFAFYLG